MTGTTGIVPAAGVTRVGPPAPPRPAVPMRAPQAAAAAGTGKAERPDRPEARERPAARGGAEGPRTTGDQAKKPLEVVQVRRGPSAEGEGAQPLDAEREAREAREAEGAGAREAEGRAQGGAPSGGERMAKEIEEQLEMARSEISFGFDEETGRHFFRLIDPVTREIVKQFPPDEFLTMVKRLREASGLPRDGGVLIDRRL